MNLKTTLVLLVLVVAAGGLVWFGQLPPALDPAPPPPPVADQGTRSVLAQLKPAQITRIEMHNGDGVTILQRKPDGTWSMPGNWPTRKAEVDALAQLLGQLHSRFEPVPIGDDLQAYGLDRPAVTIRLETDNQKYLLSFGEKETAADSTPFTRETFLRLDKKPEVVRLAPGLVAMLNRPAEYYQQRRIFPAERVAKEGESKEKVERLTASRVAVQETKKDGLHYTLAHTDNGWQLSEPVADRLDAPVRDAFIAAVPDLWAERFLTTGPTPLADLLASAAPGDLASATSALFWLTPQGLLVKSGLTNPERTLTITKPNGDTITLFIGAVSTTHAKQVPRPPQPMFPGAEPGFQTVFEEYRYAKLKDNEQIFEIRGDKLKDVFVAVDTLRDAHVARFNTADARRVEIKHGGEDIVLEKTKDHWKLIKPLEADADTPKVTDLLTKLADLQARDKDILDKADPKMYGLDKPTAVVAVTVEEEVKGGDQRDAGTTGNKEKKEKKTRTLTVRIGKHDKDKKKLYVMAGDWPRVNVVDDSLEPLVTRTALAYRGKRLFDFNPSDVAKIDLDNAGRKFTLTRDNEAWSLTKPVKAEVDTAKVDQLADSLGKLEVVEYVDQTPKKDDLETRYGLGKPALTVKVEFRDNKKPPQVLHVGKARGSKPGYFAQRAAAAGQPAPVFAVSSEMHNELTRDALSYRPLTLWQVMPEDIVSLRIHKAGQKPYTLTRSADAWKITGPFEASALAATVQQITAKLAAPKVESYKAHEAKDLATYGLDKPALTVTLKTKDDKDYTLQVGKPTAEDGAACFAKLGDKPAVFEVSDAVVRLADHKALDLLDTTLLRIAPTQLERIQTKSSDNTLTLEKKGDAWRVTVSPAGTYPADAEAASVLGFLWSSLHAERFADYGSSVDWAKYGLDKPALRLTATTRKGNGGSSEHTIELGKGVPGEPGARYARVDAGAGVAVLPLQFARLLTRTYLDYVKRDVLTFDSAAVNSLQRHMGEGVLEIVKQDDAWQVTKPATEKADDKGTQQLLDQLGTLRADRIAAYPVKDLKDFGLDSPAALVTIKLKSDQKPTEHIIKLSKSTGDHGERFALVDDSKAVAVLPGALAERLVGSPVTFRDRTIARFSDADRLRLERGPRTAVFSRVEGSWKLTEPLQADAEQDQLDDFLNSLARLRADALVTEASGAAALKKYGLDRPEARWRLQSGDKDVLNLLVGDKETKGTRRYAKLAKGDLVFLLDPRLSQKVLDEYRPRTVWMPPLDAVQIESLNYRYSRSPFLLEKMDNTWQAVGKPDVKLNPATVEDTLAALAGMKLSRYVVDKGDNLALFGLDKPSLVLEVATRSGKRVLHIGNTEADSKRHYARIDDPAHSGVFVLDEATCARILRDLTAFGKPHGENQPQINTDK